MTLFELVKIALDELYEEAVAEYGSEADKKIKKKLTYLSTAYSKLQQEDSPPIDYKSPAVRFAYVYMYVATHGDYLLQAMDRYTTKEGVLFPQETARISCIGGGPGSDIIAALRFISVSDEESAKKLICYLVDGEQAWADAWTEFSSSVETDVLLTTNFQPLDVTDPSSWKHQKKFLSADVFTLSYFVSEVCRHDDNGAVSDFFDKLFQSAKAGSVIFYVDNGYKAFNEFIDAVISRHPDWDVIEKLDNYWITPSFDEQASNLGDYTIKFERSPKLKSFISSRILKKKE